MNAAEMRPSEMQSFFNAGQAVNSGSAACNKIASEADLRRVSVKFKVRQVTVASALPTLLRKVLSAYAGLWSSAQNTPKLFQTVVTTEVVPTHKINQFRGSC